MPCICNTSLNILPSHAALVSVIILTCWYSQGLDGVKDFSYALYTHEDKTASLLGPRWGGRDPRLVLQDPAYYQDLIDKGPDVGASLVVTTTRPLPVEETRR